MTRFLNLLQDAFDGMSVVQGSAKYLFAALIFYTFGYLPAILAFEFDAFAFSMVLFGFAVSLCCIFWFYQHIYREVYKYTFGKSYSHERGYVQELERKLAERCRLQQETAEVLEDAYFMIYRDYKRTVLNGTSEEIARAHRTLSKCCKEIDENRRVSGVPTT